MALFTLSDLGRLPFMNSQSSEDILTLSEKYLNRRVAATLWQGLSDTPPSPDSLLSAKPYNTNLAQQAPSPVLHAIVFHSAAIPVLRKCSAARGQLAEIC